MAIKAIAWGVSNAPVSSADMSGADADLTAAPGAGERLVISEMVISADTAMRVDIKEETSGTVMFSIFLPAGGCKHIVPKNSRRLPTAAKKAVGRTSASGNVRILLAYRME